MSAHLEKLNERQRAAVQHGIGLPSGQPGGPLLIIAGAGSGKTNTLAHRVAHLIVNGSDPRRILLMTFSRRAAAEMARRVERICARILGDKAGILTDALTWAGTFHGIGARILREFASEIGLDPQFSIHDREDSADLMNIVRHDLVYSKTESRFPTKGTCLSIYSRAVNAEATLSEILRANYPWCAGWEKQLRELFAGYVEAKQAQNVLDYDDLLLYWAQTMSDPTLADEIGGRWEHVLVDEYQDTNRLQASILTGLKPAGRGLTVVGDDAQAIYAFRAATVRNILDFPKEFSPPAEVITLDRNYRSTQPILEAANNVIGLAKERFTKDLWTDRQSVERPRLVTVRDEAEQARFVADEVLANREMGQRLKDQAVLFRTSHHSGPLEVELTRRNIPFVKFGGLKFLDSAHVKDMLAALRFAQNMRDRVCGFRVMQLLPGVGPSTVRATLDALADSTDPIETLTALPCPPRAAADWPGFLALLGELRSGAAGWPAEIGQVRAWYEPHLERIHEDFEMRRADLIQLEDIAAGYPSRERFLTELTLDPPDATSGQAGVPLLDEDYLILSTIHSAKGQEWRSVFVLNTVDGCIPSDLSAGTSDELEEERRLLYVAMTRAKDSLNLVVPQRFFTHAQSTTGDRHVYASRTRFIPAALLSHFDRRSWPVTPTEDRPGEKRIRARIKEVTGLNASAGISYCKFLAKIASDLNKPNGQAVITPRQGPGFVEKLAVSKFHGVGPATASKMERLGILTGADLRAKSLGFLQQHFGKSGLWYYEVSRGIDERPVRPDRPRKSVGVEDTFTADLVELEPARAELRPLIEKVWRHCESKSLRGRTITLKVKFADFQQITRSRTVALPPASVGEVETICDTLLAQVFPFRRGVRLLGVTISSFEPERPNGPDQLHMEI